MLEIMSQQISLLLLEKEQVARKLVLSLKYPEDFRCTQDEAQTQTGHTGCNCRKLQHYCMVLVGHPRTANRYGPQVRYVHRGCPDDEVWCNRGR